jgi:hypothetical protein
MPKNNNNNNKRTPKQGSHVRTRSSDAELSVFFEQFAASDNIGQFFSLSEEQLVAFLNSK